MVSKQIELFLRPSKAVMVAAMVIVGLKSPSAVGFDAPSVSGAMSLTARTRHSVLLLCTEVLPDALTSWLSPATKPTIVGPVMNMIQIESKENA